VEWLVGSQELQSDKVIAGLAGSWQGQGLQVHHISHWGFEGTWSGSLCLEKKKPLTWRYLFMRGWEQVTCPWQPGPGFVYVKPGETRWKQRGLGFISEARRVQVSFMKPRRLAQEHCFSGESIVSQA
jgi:hypothetical protein